MNNTSNNVNNNQNNQNATNNTNNANNTTNLNIKSGMAPQTIGQLRMPKSRNTVLIMLIFIAILFGVLFYLPDIYSYLNNIDPSLLRPSDSSSSHITYTDNYSSIFELNDTSRIVVDNVVFTNFSIKNNTIEYKIANYNTSSISVSNLNLYLSVYNENQTILGTYEITGLIIKPDTVTDSLTNITTTAISSIKYIKISKNSDVEIADVELTSDSSGYEYLTCTLNYDQYIYYFINRQLKKINYTFDRTYTDNDTYVIEKESLNDKKGLYQSVDGYTSNVYVLANDVARTLKFSADIDLTSENRSDIGDELLLSENTSANQVNFTIESKGYDCR